MGKRRIYMEMASHLQTFEVRTIYSTIGGSKRIS